MGTAQDHWVPRGQVEVASRYAAAEMRCTGGAGDGSLVVVKIACLDQANPHCPLRTVVLHHLNSGPPLPLPSARLMAESLASPGASVATPSDVSLVSFIDNLTASITWKIGRLGECTH